MSSVRGRVAQLEARLPAPPAPGSVRAMSDEQLVARLRGAVPRTLARWRRGADPGAADLLRRLVDVRHTDLELEAWPVVLLCRQDLRGIATPAELVALGVPDAGR